MRSNANSEPSTQELQVLSRRLIEAMMRNAKIEELRSIIEQGANINVPGENGLLPLAFAVKQKNEKLTSFLIQNGADVNVVDKDGNTPLLDATYDNYDGDIKIVKLLVEKGNANVNIANKFGNTPLSYCLLRNDTKMVNFFIENELDINLPDKQNGNTALIMAVEMDKTEIVKLLIDCGAKIDHANNIGNTALIMAVKMNKTEIVKLLIDRGAKIDHANNIGNTALTDAVYYNKFDIDDTASSNAVLNKTVLCSKNKEIKNILLKAGADINKVNCLGTTPFCIAYENQDAETVNQMINYKSGLQNGEMINYVSIKNIDNESVLCSSDRRALILISDIIQDGREELFKKIVDNFNKINPNKPVDFNEFVRLREFESHLNLSLDVSKDTLETENKDLKLIIMNRVYDKRPKDFLNFIEKNLSKSNFISRPSSTTTGAEVTFVGSAESKERQGDEANTSSNTFVGSFKKNQKETSQNTGYTR